MKVLVVGSGAREHALVSAVSRSRTVTAITCVPGNAGISQIANCELIPVTSIDLIAQFASRGQFDLAVIGPEVPLAHGLADRLVESGVATFGPRRDAARLEWSKSFAKELMTRVGVATASYQVFRDAQAAHSFAESFDRVVVKADGIAAGKGVFVCHGRKPAHEAIEDLMVTAIHGDAGKCVVIEELLEGTEVSYHVLSDGERFVRLGAARDYKKAFDGDEGPNTGGMGAIAPVAAFSDGLQDRIDAEVVRPVLAELAAEGTPLRGCLFVGLMLTAAGPVVLEFNARLGDPEATVLLDRIESDVAGLLMAVATGRLEEAPAIVLSKDAIASVVLASEGYPLTTIGGARISGLEKAMRVPGVNIFQADTRLGPDGLYAGGGRSLVVSGRSHSVRDAAQKAYAAIELIDFPGAHFRRDIGLSR